MPGWKHRLVERAEREIKRLVIQRRAQAVPINRPNHQPRGRRLLMKLECDGGREQQFMIVGHSQGEGAVRLSGLEAGALDGRSLDQPQRLLDGSDDLQRARGRLQVPPDPHQQRIIEQPPEPRQRARQPRLPDRQLLRRTGDVPLPHQGLEHDQQIEVDVPEKA